MAWFSEGEINNPGNNELLADTGATNGISHLVVIFSAAIAASARLEHQAEDGEVKHSQVIRTPVSGTQEIVLANGLTGDVEANDKIKVFSHGSFIGKVQASIIIPG